MGAAGGKEFSHGANGLDWDEVAELCGTGMSQSPIDARSDMAVPAASQAGDRGVTTFGASTDLNKVNIENTGHGLNTNIDGIIYPLEVPLVTITNVTEELAVIGTMYKYGDMNPLLEKLWPTEADDFAFRIKGEEAPEDYLHAKGAKKDINGFEIDVLKDLFPQDTSYFAYRGSLTTPHAARES